MSTMEYLKIKYLRVCNSFSSQKYTFQRFLLSPIGCTDNDKGLAGGPSSCEELVQSNVGPVDECAPDHMFGKHCRKSCGTCGKMVFPSTLIFYPIKIDLI